MMLRRGMLLIALLSLASPVPVEAQARSFEGRVHAGGRERTFLVDLPPQYDGRRALPVVILFHGGGGNGRQVRDQTKLTRLAREEGFIAVYPNGSGRREDRLLTWNARTCCAYAQQHGVDELAFARALLDTLQASLRVDSARIYLAGISNGGMMAYQVACALGGRIAAVGVVSGELTVTDCRPPSPVSVVHIHGTADEMLPFNGGRGENSLAPHDVRPVSYAIDTWRMVDACPATPTISRQGSVTHTRYGPCAGGTTVELYAIEGGSHAWPGADPPRRAGRRRRARPQPSTALDATKVLWSFFEASSTR